MSPQRKGRLLELHVAALLRRLGIDPGAKRMHRSGALEHRKGDTFTVIRYCFEAKAHERVQLWPWWEQARYQTRMGLQPVLVVGGDDRPPLAVMDLEALLNLIKIEADYLAQIPERAPLRQRDPRAPTKWKRKSP